MKWYLVSWFYDNGKVNTQIFAEDEAEDLDTTSYTEQENCDRYVDVYDTLEEAEEAAEEAKYA